MKFRRKSATPEPAETSVPPETEAAALEPARGPWDEETAPEAATAADRIDFGSLLLTPPLGRELRLQVDEASGSITAVLIAAEEGAVELKAFAAPRGGDLWGEALPQIRADVAQRGGTATEQTGAWGAELAVQLPVQLPDGSRGIQASRIVGVNGGRWLLRATFLGKPAVDEESAKEWDDLLSDVVVRRGKQAMPKGEALPLSMPAGLSAQ